MDKAILDQVMSIKDDWFEMGPEVLKGMKQLST